MRADLDRLVTLQRLDLAIQDASRRLAALPPRLATAQQAVDTARHALKAQEARLAASQAARAALEQDVAVQEARLAKYRVQTASVKTNQEFHAIQHEMSYAQDEVRGLEARILERMEEADALAAAIAAAEAALTGTEQHFASESAACADERASVGDALASLHAERHALAALVAPTVLSTYDTIAGKRNGIGIATIEAGICAACHVRLRPQIATTAAKAEGLVQCESCGRILVVPPAAGAVSA